MFEISNLDKNLSNLKDELHLKKFFDKTFNYKIDNIENFEFYFQKIDNEVTLYIYEKKEKNIVYAYEFIDEDNEVYMEKSFYKEIVINTIYMQKCIKLYNENKINDNIILFVMALNSDNPKNILLQYLDENLVEQLLKK